MNTKVYIVVSCCILGTSIFLSACNDNQGISEQKAAVVNQPTSKYESTLAEGIDFKRPGYPNFLVEVSGVSAQEEWGRWTDANLGPVKFRFDKPLPKQFILELQASAFGSNQGKPIKIRAGNIEKTVTLKESVEQSIYEIKFDGVDSTDSIEIIAPNPSSPHDVDPKNTDERKIALGLISLKIKSTDQ